MRYHPHTDALEPELTRKDWGDDLVYSAESAREEIRAVLRNVNRASHRETQEALEILREAKALLNDAITECE